MLGVAFRALARAHLFDWFVSHQRLGNTFVTNIRGPGHRLQFAGSEVDDLVAISPIAGNVTVAFAAVSYAGRLTITVIADPDSCPDLAALAPALDRDLQTLAGAHT